MKNKKDKIDFKHNLGVYWKLAKQYKWMFVWIIFIIMLINIARIIEKFILKELIDRGTEFTAGNLALGAFISILIVLLVIFVVSLIVRVTGNWIQLHLINRLDSRIILDLKRKYFNHILHLDYSFHTTHK